MDELAGQTREEAETHRTQHPYQECLYPHSQVMVRCKEEYYIYGKIGEILTEEILGDGMIKYLLLKNKDWTENIMWLMDWDAMGSYMGNLGGWVVREVNVVTFTDSWQNGGQQKNAFFTSSEEDECPSACGKMETQHFLSCKAPSTVCSFRKSRDTFREAHTN